MKETQQGKLATLHLSVISPIMDDMPNPRTQHPPTIFFDVFQKMGFYV